MDSDDLKLQTMQVFETQVWPEIARLEHAFRRTDWLVLGSTLMALLVLSIMTAFVSRPWTGVLCGLGIGFGFGVGNAFSATMRRRREYGALLRLHHEAELELRYHGDES